MNMVRSISGLIVLLFNFLFRRKSNNKQATKISHYNVDLEWGRDDTPLVKRLVSENPFINLKKYSEWDN